MERDEASVDNDPTLVANPEDSSARTAQPQPRPVNERTENFDAGSVAQHDAASSPSDQDADDSAPRLERTAVSDPGPGRTAGGSGEGASWLDLPSGPSAAEDGPSRDQELLLPTDHRQRFSAQWSDIQAHFVDQPRQSVEQADALVVDIMQRVTAGFSHERERLEAQWEQGEDVSTEDLRVALTRYRSFFDRLISA